ncbi:4246_t:CDS:2, partial [Racocetra persica]
NYSEEEEINEIIKLAVDAYRASDKGSKAWLEHVEQEIESKKIEAGMTEKRAQEILNTIDNGEFLIRVKFIRDDSVYGDKFQTTIAFKIIDKYELIRESKKAGIDEKFLVREVSEQSEVGKLDSNAVVYGLYRIRKPDVNRLIPMKDGALNCVAQRVIEHFDNTKRGHGLTEIRARVQDVAELEKILNRPIKLLDITHSTIFNSGKYRSGKYEEIGMGDTWEAISNILRGPQAIWLMGVGIRVKQYPNWQYQEGIINKEKKSILSESLKVVDLAEQ